MRLLLDTHALLWALAAPARLSAEASEAIADARNDVHVSVASAWELCIKASLGKLDLDAYRPLIESAARFGEELSTAGFDVLGISAAHVFETRRLPLHHRDPFDRLLVAQARVEDLVLVTRDAAFEKYEVRLLPA